MIFWWLKNLIDMIINLSANFNCLPSVHNYVLKIYKGLQRYARVCRSCLLCYEIDLTMAIVIIAGLVNLFVR